MADLIYVAGIITFFTVAALYVGACDRIVGRDEVAVLEPDASPAPESRSERSAA